MKSKFDNVLEMIGNTPVLKINNIDTGKCDLYVKMESLNPFGSIKDRVGLKMIEDAENSQMLIMSGGAAGDPDESLGADISFFVSGAIGSKATAVNGTALFGGDTVVSGDDLVPFLKIGTIICSR